MSDRDGKNQKTPGAASEAVLWTDGASRGNPGPAGAGAILKTPAGDVLFSASCYLGHTTNNVAEYRALLVGLSGALEQGVRRVDVRADSELLIKQLTGEYRVKSPLLKPLFAQAKALLSRFEAVRLQHVRRALNAEADALANQGIDERDSVESASKSADK